MEGNSCKKNAVDLGIWALGCLCCGVVLFGFSNFVHLVMDAFQYPFFAMMALERLEDPVFGDE